MTEVHKYPPGSIQALRLEVSRVIAEEKAYSVPHVCVRYGLAEGEQREAFDSKRNYVLKRMQALSNGEVVATAEAVFQDYGDPQLGSALDKVKAVAPADPGISAVLAHFDEAGVHADWAKALDRRDRDPAGAITMARTLIENTCRTVLAKAGQEPPVGAELTVLYRQAAKVLRLAPDDHTEEAFKRILGSCQNVVETLATLRNRLGDAHGGPGRGRPAPRHAQLAVNLAGAMATFLVATWQSTNGDSQG
ncbi:hypothetical protein GJ689_21515 [Rhodoplanes serenus]|uniref:Abortive infection protein-like C-terminal domain-containing protein n=1 Tax=Rhodoplanes serenus TaxID=200615 RepID=A0A9X5AV98_9BRAD|nr:abortive infection family protein [Rhodoplanes serenus]MTW18783.1 hypothetical protein [Rhodoplanes serenus]